MFLYPRTCKAQNIGPERCVQGDGDCGELACSCTPVHAKPKTLDRRDACRATAIAASWHVLVPPYMQSPKHWTGEMRAGRRRLRRVGMFLYPRTCKAQNIGPERCVQGDGDCGELACSC